MPSSHPAEQTASQAIIVVVPACGLTAVILTPKVGSFGRGWGAVHGQSSRGAAAGGAHFQFLGCDHSASPSAVGGRNPFSRTEPATAKLRGVGSGLALGATGNRGA